jgi:hypothetical protein
MLLVFRDSGAAGTHAPGRDEERDGHDLDGKTADQRPSAQSQDPGCSPARRYPGAVNARRDLRGRLQ